MNEFVPIRPRCLYKTRRPFLDVAGYLYPFCVSPVNPTTNGERINIKYAHYLDQFHLDNADLDKSLGSPEWRQLMGLMTIREKSFPMCQSSCLANKTTNVFRPDKPDSVNDTTPHLNVELSTRCALACPKCARTTNPELYDIQDMKLEYVRRVADHTTYNMIVCCGNFGDPILHRQFHEVLKILIDSGKQVVIVTSGSRRSKQWWEETAKIMSKSSKSSIVFSVDGLHDTNHIYRVNSDWDSIMDGMRITGSYNIYRKWKFIVFKHNQHQIELARTTAKQLGMDFSLIYSSRYDSVDDPFRPDEKYVAKPVDYTN